MISDYPKEYEVLFARGLAPYIRKEYNINQSFNDSWNAQVIEMSSTLQIVHFKK